MCLFIVIPVTTPLVARLKIPVFSISTLSQVESTAIFERSAVILLWAPSERNILLSLTLPDSVSFALFFVITNSTT